MVKSRESSLRAIVSRAPETEIVMDELLKQQVAILVWIDRESEHVSAQDELFWNQAAKAVAGSRDLGVALDMLSAAASAANSSEHRQVLAAVSSEVRKALLEDSVTSMDDVC